MPPHRDYKLLKLSSFGGSFAESSDPLGDAGGRDRKLGDPISSSAPGKHGDPVSSSAPGMHGEPISSSAPDLHGATLSSDSSSSRGNQVCCPGKRGDPVSSSCSGKCGDPVSSSTSGKRSDPSGQPCNTKRLAGGSSDLAGVYHTMEQHIQLASDLDSSSEWAHQVPDAVRRNIFRLCTEGPLAVSKARLQAEPLECSSQRARASGR